VKAYTIVLTILLIALAYPVRADDLSAAATAGAVAHLQKMQQLFPQAPAAAQTAPSQLPQYQTNSDDEGSIGTYQPNGATVIPSTAFFQNLGTNGRTCFTCHQPQNGWSLSSDSAQQRFAADPTDPLFRLIDGATCPSDDVSTPAAMQKAYSLLLNKGLIRIGLPMQSKMQFQIALQGKNLDVQDPYGCNTNPTTGLTGQKSGFLSFYRRPLPSTNMNFLSAIMWDGREQDLFQQSVDATLGHAEASNAPTAHQQQDIVSFEGCTTALTFAPCTTIATGEGLVTAQVYDNNAGDLTANPATGGPVTLAQQIGGFKLCMNDPFGSVDGCNNQTFNPVIFTAYSAWANLTGNDPQTQARLAIARGQQVFNSKQFNITDVGGINDVQGKDKVIGTCGTCHNTPNAGNRSAIKNTTLNIGVTDAKNGTPAQKNLSIDDLPVFNVQCTDGLLKGQTFQVTDLGRAMITGNCEDIGKTKVPVLRGLAGRSPYFHNGSATEIENLINFYNDRFQIGLTPQEMSDLAAFLETL
jgi:cytochrome c peroxidase